MAGLAPANFNAMYNFAVQGKAKVLQDAMTRGLDIDSLDERGNTGLCVAIWKGNYRAYNVFRSLGADARHSCVQRIPKEKYTAFVQGFSSQNTAATVANPVQKYRSSDYSNIEQLSSNRNYGHISYDPNERPLIESSTAWTIGGVALVGGGIAIALSGGGGGDDDDEGVKNIPGMSGVSGAPYVVAEDISKNVVESSGGAQSSYWGVYMPGNQNIINTKDITITNNTPSADSKDHWGAIYTKNGYAYNSGDILINSSNKFAKGIMSCIVDVYNPNNTACIVDPTNPIAGDIQNAGSIKIIANQSMGIFSTTTKKITNSGLIDMSGDDNTGIWLLGNGDIENSGRIVVNGNNTNYYAGAMTGIWVSGTSNINNSGKITIVSGSKGGTGIYTQKGSITNSGEISLTGGGVGMQVNEGNLTNNGTVKVSGSDSAAYALKVINSGEVVNNGTITMGALGGGIYSGGGSVTNGINGVITTAFDTAITANGSVTNKGKIVSGKLGISASSAVNEGSIQAGTTGILVTDSGENKGTITANTGMYVASGSLSNSGIITANSIGLQAKESGIFTNSGTIKAGTYGMKIEAGSIENSGDVNAQLGALTTSGTITNTSTGTIIAKNVGMLIDNTVDAEGKPVAGTGTFVNDGKITIDGDVVGTGIIGNNGYGMFSNTGVTLDDGKFSYSSLTATNNGKITINNSRLSGNISGMWAEDAGNLTNGTNAEIIINDSTGVADVISGMKAGNVQNIIITDRAQPAATSSTLTNDGKIIINAFDATRSNIYGMGLAGEGTATNNGEIIINGNDAFGMIVAYDNTTLDAGEVKARIVNNGRIFMNGDNNVAMSASGHGSAITNNGIIEIKKANVTDVFHKVGDEVYTGSATQCDSFICLQNGAIYENSGTTTSAYAMNFEDFGDGSVYLGKGGKFEAPELSGKVLASSDIVKGSNLDTYASEDAFVGEDKGLDLQSGSYLFEASLKDNGDGSKDVVMNRKDFNNVMDNGSAANFLENNYIQGNGLDLFDQLKSAASHSSLGRRVNRELGLNFFPNFAKQNIDLIKSMNRSINNSVLSNDDSKDERETVGYDYLNRDQDGTSELQGYEDEANTVFGMFDKKYDNQWRYGWGLSYSKYNSKYDSSNKRNENIIQIFAPVSYKNDKFQFISTPRLGYGWGDYTRFADDGLFSSDVDNYYYGIGNELRQDIDVGYLVFEPLIEFNILGLYQGGLNENNKLDIDSSNNLSVEGGLGLYAKKTFEISEDQKINLRAGGTVYYEFGDPYTAMKARMSGMDGTYHLNSYAVQRTRAVLSARAEYQYKQMSLYSQFNKYIEDAEAYEVNAGLDWKF